MPPLGPLPENNTNRLFVIQKGPGGAHETIFRWGEALSKADAIVRARAIVSAVLPGIATSVSFVGARWQEAGTHVSFPVVWGAALTGTSPGAYLTDKHPVFLSFTGRSVDGRRVRITFFGATYAPTDNFRIERAEGAAVNAVLNTLINDIPSPVTISGGMPVWNEYGNIGWNSYFQRKKRRST